MIRSILILCVLFALSYASYGQQSNFPKGSLLLHGTAGFSSFRDNMTADAAGGAYFFIHRFVGVGGRALWNRISTNRDSFTSFQRTVTAAPGLRLQYMFQDRFALFVEPTFTLNYLKDETTSFSGNPPSTVTTTVKDEYAGAMVPLGVAYFPKKWLGIEARVPGFSYTEIQDVPFRSFRVGTSDIQIGLLINIGILSDGEAE